MGYTSFWWNVKQYRLVVCVSASAKKQDCTLKHSSHTLHYIFIPPPLQFWSDILSTLTTYFFGPIVTCVWWDTIQRFSHNGPLFFQYHTSWSVGSEGTTLTSGSLRVQRHPSQVSVRRGKFYSVWRHCQWVKVAPTYRDPGRVSLDSQWPTGYLTWYPQIPWFMKVGIEKISPFG